MISFAGWQLDRSSNSSSFLLEVTWYDGCYDFWGLANDECSHQTKNTKKKPTWSDGWNVQKRNPYGQNVSGRFWPNEQCQAKKPTSGMISWFLRMLHQVQKSLPNRLFENPWNYKLLSIWKIGKKKSQKETRIRIPTTSIFRWENVSFREGNDPNLKNMSP